MATRLERTAYHEAGHAVMAIRYKISFKYVTIEPSESEDTLGHVKFREYPTWLDLENVDERTNRWSEKRILVSLAGQAAECHLIGRENWIGAGQDWHSAVELAGQQFIFGSKTQAAYLSYLRERVKEEIALLQNWHDIEALASGLLEQTRLSAQAVRQLLRGFAADFDGDAMNFHLPATPGGSTGGSWSAERLFPATKCLQLVGVESLPYIDV